MIKNEKQYRISRAWVRKFEDSLFELASLPESKKQPWLRKGQRESIEQQLVDLRAEIKEYEALKSGRMKLPPLDSLNNVPELLIKWRIKRNWSQKELAEKLGLAEQQVQKYESTNYSSATLDTLLRVATALNDLSSRSGKTPA
jgi:DNA-binding Xre family transcriptional regulator